MRKKDYVFGMTNLILNRVRFHSPKSETSIDFDKILSSGVDATKPVFIFSKPMSKLLAKCFEKAQKEEDFNLVLPEEEKNAKKLEVIISREKELEKLNINYPSGLKFDLKERENYLKINGEKAAFSFSGFFFEAFKNLGDIYYFSRQFALSGINTMVELTNLSTSTKECYVDMSLILPKGYYSFQRGLSHIKVTNLRTFETKFFNFSTLTNSFSFSCVDGVQNSCFARIYLKAKVTLKPKQRKTLFFSFSSEKFSLSTKEEIEYFMEIARVKLCQIFNLKIRSNDKKRESLVNNILPEKIISAWLKNGRDKQSEIKYGLLKDEVLAFGKNGIVFNNLKGIEAIKIFDGKNYLSVPIIRNSVENEKEFLQIGKTKFFGMKALSFKDLGKKEVQIYV